MKIATVFGLAWRVGMFLAAILAIAYPVFAVEGPPTISDHIGVAGKVLRYAEVQNTNRLPLSLPRSFTGIPNEEISDGTAHFTVETNTAVDITFLFELRHITDPDDPPGTPLLTFMQIYQQMESGFWLNNGEWTTGSFTQPNAQLAKSIADYQVNIKAKTNPSISGQEAGDYEGAVTLTVSSSD